MKRKANHYRKRRGSGWAVLACSLLCAVAVCAGVYFWLGGSLETVPAAAPPASAPPSSSQTGQAVSSLPPESAPDAASLPSSGPEPEPEPEITTVRVSASGDNLIHDGLYLQAKKRAAAAGKEGYDFAALYEHAASLYQNFDLNLINVETLMSDELTPSAYPRFCTPGDCARELYRIGFRGFFLSNNHIYDKDGEGLASTLRFWDSMPEDAFTSGLYADEQDFPMCEYNGISFAFLAYTEMTNGLSTPAGAEKSVIYTSEEDVIHRQIEQAREQADVVVVSAHWGVENTHEVTDGQRAFAQKLADWGADIVIGTHPHVVQPIETVTSSDGREVPVAYSLGNFVSAQDRVDNMIGIVLGFEVTKTTQPGGESEIAIDNISATPVVMFYERYYANMRLYLLRDYTDELAASHGLSGVTPAYVRSMLEEIVAPEYLRLD